MDDQPTTPSSSPAEHEPAAVPPTDRAPDGDERRQRLRSRAILAGAATALTLGGGLTGFVIGHSTASDDDFAPANFSRQGPGGDGRFNGPPSPPRDDQRRSDGRPDGSGSSRSDDPT